LENMMALLNPKKCNICQRDLQLFEQVNMIIKNISYSEHVSIDDKTAHFVCTRCYDLMGDMYNLGTFIASLFHPKMEV
jgi:hypothetical protein